MAKKSDAFRGMPVSGSVIELDCTKVERYKGQPRRKIERKKLDKLKEGIAEIGQLDPVHVKELTGSQRNGKTHGLIDGERRFQACSELDIPVRALVCRPKNEDHRFIHSVSANFNREGHTPMEICGALHRIKAMPHIQDLPQGDQMAALSRMFGKSEVWVWQYYGLERLSDELQQALEDEQMPTAIAVRLSGMPVKYQRELWAEIKKRKLKTSAAHRLINRTIEEEGLESTRRGRKPSDEWALLQAYVNRTSEGVGPFLDLLEEGKFEKMLESRGIWDCKNIGEELKGTIERLQKLYAAVYQQYAKMAG